MAKRIKIILLIACLSISAGVHAQSRFLKRGDRAYEKQEYVDALNNYKKIRKKDISVEMKMAGCYYYMKKYDLAMRYYKKVGREELPPQALVNYSRIELLKGNYSQALSLMEAAGREGADPIFVKNQVKGIKWAMDGAKNLNDYRVSDTKIRLTGKAFGIQNYDSGLVYSRLVKTKKRKKSKKYMQLYSVDRKGDEFGAAHAVAQKLDRKANVGAAVFSADGKTLYYTRGEFDKKGQQHMTIMKAVKNDKQWKSTGELSMNGKGFSCAFPALSPDEQALCFSSDRPGGMGGMDLYVCYRKAKGWGKPQNMGELLNTAGDELYPYMAGETQLWFASDGHIGLGGLDIFNSQKKEAGEWGAPQNAGAPINSSLNDYCLISNPVDKNHFYMLSDRLDRGGRDRIFHVKKMEKKVFTVLVRDALTDNPINDALVKVVRDSDGVMIGEKEGANENGEYLFSLAGDDVEKGISFVVSATKQQYQNEKIDFSPSQNRLSLELKMKPEEIEEEVKFEIRLKPILYPNRKLIFHNIFFNYNTAALTMESRVVMDRLVKFLKAYPRVKLKLNAHTDCRGDELVNMKLSRARATAAKNYLVKKGVDKENIEARGWGEKYILNRCVDGVECEQKEHEYNRRLELIVIL